MVNKELDIWLRLQPAMVRLGCQDVSRKSLATLEAQFRRVPDCELLFLSKVLEVKLTDLFPAQVNLKKLDPNLQLKMSRRFPRKKHGQRAFSLSRKTRKDGKAKG